VTSVNVPAIRAAVASVWARLGSRPDNEHRGPVLLAPFIESFDLIHVAIPKLTRAAVFDHLQAKGITPVDDGDEDEVLAGFLFTTPGAGLVFVNGSDPIPRQRFTAAHELGHFVLHREAMGGRISKADTPAQIELTDEKSDEHERQANRFAVELLMPEAACRARADAFRTAYGICPRGPLAYQLAADLLVSREAMRYRLNQLEVGDEPEPRS
jgi:Zn-dependent peptidase ImmA (M78 family)